MTKNRTEVCEGLISAVHEFLGPKDLDDIDEKTNPITQLGMESCDGLDFACMLSEKFGFDLPTTVNPFVDDAKQCARNIGEMADLIVKLGEQQEEERNVGK
jgi:hypothetical protein